MRFWQDANKPLRCKGQPLFKELKSLDFLLERKKLMTQLSVAERVPAEPDHRWRRRAADRSNHRDALLDRWFN